LKTKSTLENRPLTLGNYKSSKLQYFSQHYFHFVAILFHHAFVIVVSMIVESHNTTCVFSLFEGWTLDKNPPSSTKQNKESGKRWESKKRQCCPIMDHGVAKLDG
jgi:hypothetical protein